MFFKDTDSFGSNHFKGLMEVFQKFNEIGCFAPIDLYIDAILKRTMIINEAFVRLAKTNNYIAAAPYIRMQMDNCINLGAGIMVKDVLAYINHFLSGKELYKFKDERKNSLYEKYIVQEMGKRYGGFKQAYEHYNKEIHLSVGHFYMAHFLDEENYLNLSLEHGHYHRKDEISSHNKNILLANEVLIDVLLNLWLPIKQSYIDYIDNQVVEGKGDYENLVKELTMLYPYIYKTLTGID